MEKNKVDVKFLAATAMIAAIYAVLRAWGRSSPLTSEMSH